MGGMLGFKLHLEESSGDNDTYHGQPDVRCLRDCHTPDTESHGYGATAFYVAEYDREVVMFAHNEQINNVKLFYRQVNQLRRSSI